MNERLIDELRKVGLKTANEASELLGVTKGTLAVWRSTGRYDLMYVKVGRKVMYRPADIEAFIERRLRTQTD